MDYYNALLISSLILLSYFIQFKGKGDPMNIKSKEDIFNHFMHLTSYLPQLFDEDIILGITDREKFIFQSINENIPVTVRKGDLVTEGDGMFEAMENGRTFSVIVPREKFGIIFKSTSIPIEDEEGNIIGSFGIGRSLEKQEKMALLSENLSKSLQEISKAIMEVSIGVQDASTSNSSVLKVIRDTNESARETDEIIRFVNGVARQTNLLGLNASIEAARAGVHGMGFDVVAKEIRKLSTSSGESIQKIDSILGGIRESMGHILKSTDKVDIIFQEQAAAVEEITANIEELNSTAIILEEMANEY